MFSEGEKKMKPLTAISAVSVLLAFLMFGLIIQTEADRDERLKTFSFLVDRQNGIFSWWLDHPREVVVKDLYCPSTVSAINRVPTCTIYASNRGCYGMCNKWYNGTKEVESC